MNGVALVSASHCNEEHQVILRLMWPKSWLAAPLIGVRGPHLFGAVHHGMSRCSASQRNRASVDSLQTSLFESEMESRGSQRCLQSKVKTQAKVIRFVTATRDLQDVRFAGSGMAFLTAPRRRRELMQETEHATSRSSLLRTRPRLNLVCI